MVTNLRTERYKKLVSIFGVSLVCGRCDRIIGYREFSEPGYEDRFVKMIN